MQTMSFIEAFIEVYIALASLVIIFLIISILFMMHKVDKGVLKARLFLNDAVMQQTWIYLSVAGASFALNTLIIFLERFNGVVLDDYYIVEVTRIIFLMAFILASLNWYEFMGSFQKHRRFEAQS